MALADYTPEWIWFADDLTLDLPTSGVTKSNQSGLSDPSIAGSGDTYADFTLSTGVMFTPTSPLGNNGTGDKTIVLKLQLDTSSAGRMIAENYDGSGTIDTATGWRIVNVSGTSRRIGLSAPPTSHTLEVTDSPSNFHTLGSPFIIAWRRSGGTWTMWGDADASGGMTQLTPFGNSIGNCNFSECGDISLGALRDGTSPFDGRIYWIAEFNEAISDADLQLSDWDNEGNLKAAWTSSSSDTPLVVDAASCVWEGQNVNLLFDEAYVIAVEHAQAAWEGQEIHFVLTQPYDEAECVWEGQDVALFLQDEYVLAVDSADCAFAGQSIGLNIAMVITAAQAVFQQQVVGLNWSEAPVTMNYRPPAGVGRMMVH